MSIVPTIPTDALRTALEAVRPGDVVLVQDLDWDMKTPCADCPFLKTSPFHSGVAREMPEYIDSIQSHSFAHTCHKTDNREACDGPHSFQGDRPKHCVGAIQMLLKTGSGADLQLPLLEAVEAGKLDLLAMTEAAVADDRVFTLRQMLKFYARELGKQLRHSKLLGRRRGAARRAAGVAND